MNKKIVLILSFLILILLIGNVLAITASIGNARMVLRAETGDEIEKYILVKNVNNVTVDIELFASGDLEKYINIKDEKFTLAPNEEKKAYFTIKVKEEGTTESKINVQFIPEDGKNGVGLSSTIIVIAEKGDSLFDWGDEEENNKDNEVNVITGGTISESNNGTKSVVIVLLMITGIIFLIFIVLLVVAYKKTSQKREKENKTKLTKSKKSVKKRG